MLAAAAKKASFEDMLSDAMSSERESGDQYATQLDRAINGSSNIEQDKLSSKNLSEILKNIKDYGPAGAATTAESSQAPHDEVNTESVSGEESVNEELLARIHDDVLHTVSTDTGGRMAWQIATLLLLITLLGMITLFQYRTDDNLMQISSGLEQASDDYVKQLIALQEISKPGVAEQSVTDGTVRDLEMMVSQLNEEMQMLNGRLDEMGKLQKVESSRLLSMIESEIKPRLEKLAVTEEAIAEATSNIVTTNRKLDVSAELGEPVSIDWTINLGTFSERVKADKVNRELIAKGIASRVDAADVNGTTVYRLSVGGFKTRQLADDYKTDKLMPLGYSNGWVRQG